MASLRQSAALNGLSLKELMQRVTITLLFFLATFELYAQKQGNHWVFGDSVWLEFGDTGVVQRKANISTREASTSINKLGTDSLLFYATPNTVYNNNGEAAIKGLYGHHSATQGALFITHPDNDSTIHLFTSDEINSKLRIGLYHHVLNFDGNVFLKNDTLLYQKTEQLSAVNHRNKRNIWLITHKVLSDSFYLFLLREDGIMDCPIIYHSGNLYDAFWAEGTMLKFSPNGKYLAGTMLFSDKLELYKFDTESGQLDSQILLPNVYGIFGVEFSPNSNQLYTSSSALSSLLQFDLSKFDEQSIANSKLLLANQNAAIGHIQLALNGKIYIAYEDSSYVGIINNPNTNGVGCQFIEKAVRLQYSHCRKGLPSFNQSSFYSPSVDFSYRENCHTLNYEFEAEDTFNATSYTWNFTNPDSSATQSKSGRSPSYQFSDLGRWTVELIASNGSKADTVTKTITIRPTWKPDFLGRDTFYCENDWKPITLRAPENMHCYHWMGDPSYGQPDSFVLDTAGTYFIKVTNKTFCTTYDTITVMKVPNPGTPSIERIEDTLFSDADSLKYRWYKDDIIQSGDTLKNILLRKNGTYYLRVFDDYGCSAVSNSILVDNIGLNDLTPFRVHLYPNPTEGPFQIERINGTPISVQIFDNKGALIAELDSADSTFDISGLPEGLYQVRVVTKDGIFLGRLGLY